MAGIDKMAALLEGLPVALHSVRTFDACEEIDEIVVVTRAERVVALHERIEAAGWSKVRRVVKGGATRAESSRHGVAALSPDVDLVLVHDGARPLVTDAVIRRVVEAARATGAAIPGVPPVATIKRESEGVAAETLDRRDLREAQTPQGFRRDVLAKGFASVMRAKVDPTDEAACVERTGVSVAIVAGERSNLKITVPEDLTVAEALLRGEAPPQRMRVGFGYDVHRLEPGRRLVLGGVEIPHERGLLGHSDADVLSHAICDALLGAAARGDLGVHFPDDDPAWKDVSGAELLARTLEILRESGYVPVNVDATVSAQAPRLSPHREAMIENLATGLRLPADRVSVKFTTTERLGFEGREEGISATAVAQVGTIPVAPESDETRPR
jgi:2-C-methyl-D-erythritol 2,4-cyclodiphosphate synthase/2-C-methyl-D-erythritol 4-phosphate cytidylyltransferase